MNITDEQREIISHFETNGSIKSFDTCYMFNIVMKCLFNDHDGNNHRFIVVDANI